MEEIKVTWLHATHIWWSLAWRVLVPSLEHRIEAQLHDQTSGQ